MVLINELTVEQINAALLHLQRSKDEVVGGNKGTTIQNISISNSGGGGGNNVDYSGAIQNLANNIEKNSESIEGVKVDIHNLEETIRNLSDAGISDLSYDNLSHQLTITTENGDTFQTQITQDAATLSFDPATNGLSITTGEQTQTITLPAQVQSDWTQTDNTEPDFIKNKIPIWITSGSADDNMSPVDVVEPGNTRPVTSGGVASALNNYDKATEWTGTLISICPTVGAGQEKTYTINSTTISDLPVQIRGIVTTRVNSLNNRIIQLYYCNQSNNNNIYYRYIEWNGSAWIVGVSWVKLTTTADIVDSVTVNNMQSVTSNAVASALAGAETQILYNDTNVAIRLRTLGKLALFTVYAKTSGTRNYTTPNIRYENDFGFASLLTAGGSATGEIYFNSVKNLVVSCRSSGAGQIIAFLQ